MQSASLPETPRGRPESQLQGPIRLERRRIFILPTGHGFFFAGMLLVLFLWSINYSNSMGFALTFLLSGVALNAMWRSHAQLLGLQVHPGQAEAVFAGQPAQFIFQIDNPDPQTRYGIGLRWQRTAPCYADLPGRDSMAVSLAIPTERRGPFQPGRISVFTRYPLGLFRAWSWIEAARPCLVYPRPMGRQPLPPAAAASAGSGSGEAGGGSEDYAGLRSYAPGDSPRHVAWKATARSPTLMVKRFTDQRRPELWLDWDSLQGDGLEARLSQLCQWALKAEHEGLEYGLRLPGVVVAPGHGSNHRQRCLEALALFNPGSRQR